MRSLLLCMLVACASCASAPPVHYTPPIDLPFDTQGLPLPPPKPKQKVKLTRQEPPAKQEKDVAPQQAKETTLIVAAESEKPAPAIEEPASAPGVDVREATPTELIERGITAFNDKRATMAKTPKESLDWGESWLRLLSTMRSACELEPHPSDVKAFERARGFLGQQLKSDKKKNVMLPADLPERVADIQDLVSDSAEDVGAPVVARLGTPVKNGANEVFQSPLAHYTLTSTFGVRKDPVHGLRRFHAGLDMAAPTGTRVGASAAGVVVFAGRHAGHGNQVIIAHAGGVQTRYSHLSRILVRVGQTAKPGQVIALVGSTGRSTGPHLHFAVAVNDGFVNPKAALGSKVLEVARRTHARRS